MTKDNTAHVHTQPSNKHPTACCLLGLLLLLFLFLPYRRVCSVMSGGPRYNLRPSSKQQTANRQQTTENRKHAHNVHNQQTASSKRQQNRQKPHNQQDTQPANHTTSKRSATTCFAITACSPTILAQRHPIFAAHEQSVDQSSVAYPRPTLRQANCHHPGRPRRQRRHL